MQMTIKQTLQATMIDAMSPQAVALIIAHLQPVDGNGTAQQEVAWFRELLVETVGGPDAASDLFDEVGV
jgi:hypothetical protein